MDMIVWMTVIGVVVLCIVLICNSKEPAPPAKPEPNLGRTRPAAPKPTLRVPFPQSGPQPQPPSPDYLRKWTLSRKLSEQSEMRRWQAEFAGIQLQLARRAGGLHGSSTAAPGSGGEGVPPQGSEPRIAQGARREGEAGASGEPPGRKNEKIWRKLSDTLSELGRNGAGS